ncbi:MAG: hypothetical protein HDR87_04575 [Bacteroides sp.]|nr:hypothetical protein [Bacteroides sp.]
MKKLLLSLSLAVGSLFGASAETATLTYGDLGYSNQQDFDGVTIAVPGTSIEIKYDKGNTNNSPKYYTTGAGIRFYSGNKITFSVPEGTNLTKMVFTASASNYVVKGSVDNGTFSQSGATSTWTAPADQAVNSVVLTSTATCRLQKIEFTYEAPVAAPNYGGYKEEYTLEIGQVMNVPAIAPTDLDYTFTTTNTEVISIENGQIKALAEGTATVKFTTEEVADKYLAGEGEFTVNVTKITSMIEFRDQVVYGKLGVGVVWELVNVITPEDADLRGDITYTSSDTDIITIDETTGQITPDDIHATGEVTITATMAAKGEYSEASASYKIIVIDPSAAVEPSTEQFDFTVNNAYGMTTYSSSNGSGSYETKVKEIDGESGVVTISFTGNYRSWKAGDAYQLRLQKGASMTIAVPEGYKISKIGLVATDDKGANITGSYSPASSTSIPDGESGNQTGEDVPNSTWIPATTNPVNTVTYTVASNASNASQISKIYVLYEGENSDLKTADLSFNKVVNNLYVDEVATINAVNNPFDREITYSIDNLDEDKYTIEPSEDGKTINVMVSEAGYFTLRATSASDSEYRDGLAIMRINVYRHLDVFANNSLISEDEIPTAEEVTITMTVPEHANLYYQILTAESENTPATVDEGDGDENQLPGYELYEDGIEIAKDTNGVLNFYIANYGYQSPIRKITLGKGMTTSIEAIEAEGVAKSAYDLMGRKVANPVNGLYIINGKKVRI